jgi:hypothetical protein
MAQELAPPAMKESKKEGCVLQIVLVALFLIGVVFAIAPIGAGSYIGVGIVVAAIWIAISSNRRVSKDKAAAAHYNEQVYPAEMERWSKSFLCHRCGYVGRLAKEG